MAGIGSNRISAAVGNKLTQGNQGIPGGNVPIRFAILGEANTANQSVDGLLTPTQITSAEQAATKYGAGSPIHRAALLLFPPSGGGVNSEVWVYAQAAAVASDAKIINIEVSGTATASRTHYVKINGRNNVNGEFFAVNIVKGDTATAVMAKIVDAVNNVIAAPCTGTLQSPATGADFEAKWTGLSSDEMTIEMDIQGNAVGLTYTVTDDTDGSGTPTSGVTTALDLFSNNWNNIVINTYGTVSAVLDALEAYNGKPDDDAPSGRYDPLVMKPFIALTGSVADDPTSVTSGRRNELTIVICPAPLSDGFSFEAAANVAKDLDAILVDNPHLDVMNMLYPDMPVPAIDDIPLMQSYNERDRMVKLGCSTVVIEDGAYRIKDLVTTHRPSGQVNPLFRWVRDLFIDFNIIYRTDLLVRQSVWGHTLVNDEDEVDVERYVKPKMIKSVVGDLIDGLVSDALIVDAKYSKTGLIVEIDGNNPNRVNIEFPYKRSGFGRIVDNVYKASFNLK